MLIVALQLEAVCVGLKPSSPGLARRFGCLDRFRHPILVAEYFGDKDGGWITPNETAIVARAPG
jgi:hypothetical protein